MTVIDLFAGPGGWDVAARALDLDPKGCELDPGACKTREAAGLLTWQGDVRDFLPTITGDVRGQIASPPCPTFSMAGKGAGRDALDQVLRGVDSVAMGQPIPYGEYDDIRTALVLEPLRYALELEPEWLAWEQVPTVQPVWDACAEVLRADGYSVWTGHLHAEQYGVPQTRKRSILLASRTRTMSPPEPTHSRFYSRSPGKLDLGVEKWVSMAEALGCSPRRLGMARNSGPGAARTPRGYDEPAYTIRANGSGSHPSGVEWVPTPAIEGDGPEDVAWVYDRPSPTIVGSFHPDVVAAPGYRTKVSRQNAKGSVRVTVQEAAVLQSFPVDYPWQGSRTKQYQQVGNAIPPGLALHALSMATGLALPAAEEVAA